MAGLGIPAPPSTGLHRLAIGVQGLQGYLAHKKLRPPGLTWASHRLAGRCDATNERYESSANLTQNVLKVVLQKSTPPQIRQLVLYFY